MKKIIIIILTIVMIFAGCARNYDDSMKTKDNDINLVGIETRPTPINNRTKQYDDEDMLFVGGIVVEATDNIITLADVEGITGQATLAIKVTNNTEWNVTKDMIKKGKFLTAEISRKMTRSVPPQSEGLRIVSVNDIIAGDVIKIEDNLIILRPTSNFNANEEIELRISNKTQWNVNKNSVKEGYNIKVMIANRMTASIPPKVDCLVVISIENKD